MTTSSDVVPPMAYRRPRERKNAGRTTSSRASRATRATIAMQTMPPTQMDTAITSMATSSALDGNFLLLQKSGDNVILV